MKTISTQSGFFGKLKILVVLATLAFATNNAFAQCAASFTYTVDPSNNGDVTFTNTSVGGVTPHSYWILGDGSFSYSMSPGTHNYPASGTYTVSLEYYSDSSGTCMDTTFQVISVINTTPTPCAASFSAYDSLGYVYFWNTSTGTALTSSWDFGDGTFGTSSGDTYHTYPSPGTYYACLTISNTFIGCSDTHCDTVVVSGVPSCSASFYTSISGSSVDFHDYSSAAAGSSYYWDFGDGSNSSTTGDVNHVYADGTYTACLTISNTATSCSNTYCSTFTVSAGTSSCVSYFTLVQDSLNPYNYYAYNSSSSGALYSYLWDFGDGTTSTLQYPSHTYAGSGPYYLCLTVTDGASCTASYCDSIIPGLAMWSNVTLNVLPTGIAESNNIASFENYPNPFSDYTTISYTITKDAAVKLEVTDLLGNRVAEISNENQALGEHSIRYNAANLNNGIYLMRLTVNGNSSTKKLILNR